MNHSTILSIVIGGISLMPIADRLSAQAAATAVTRTDTEHVGQDCSKLEARDSRIPSSEAGSLLRQALSACKDYRKGKLTKEQWGERILTLDEKAAFVEAPAEFLGIVPFSTAALFQGYETYSLFLFPSTEWKRKKDEVKDLYQEFMVFGDAIGDQRLAIWFSEKSDEVDIRRSKLYCDRFGLGYDDGPYVITLQKSPAVWRNGDPAVIISLGGISTERRVRVLNAIEKDLRMARELTQRPLLFVEVRERLLSAAERHKDVLKGLVVNILGLV
jgi:hypothetical protein